MLSLDSPNLLHILGLPSYAISIWMMQLEWQLDFCKHGLLKQEKYSKVTWWQFCWLG